MKDFSYKLVRLSLAALSRLPLSIHYLNSRFLAFIIEKCIRYRLDITEDNLRKSFPDKDEAWIRRTRHAFYLHFAKVIAEAIWFGGCRPGDGRLRRSRIVRMENPQVAARSWENGNGVMILSAHTGNWELSGGICKYNYSDTDNHITQDNYCVVYLRQSSAFWNSMLHRNRLAGLDRPEDYRGYLESREFVRYALTHASDRNFYNVIGDQRPYVHSGKPIHVNFMNRNCTAMTAGATIACKLGMGVIYQRMKENANGHGYTIEYVKICDDASRQTASDIIRRYFQLVEEDIRREPHNYLWTHRRWS